MNKELLNRTISSIILIPIVFFCIIKGSFFFNTLILISFLLTCYEWIKMIDNKKFKILGLLFLVFSYSTIYLIRNTNDDNSLHLFFIVILICVSTDLGGYIFGKILKGPRLIKISPNKTYAGFFGGHILSLVVIIIYTKKFYIGNLDKQMIDSQFIITIFLISVVSQLGDLVISYFKRISKVKDTGNIIPGHGGILDRTDGMIFAFPFFYILLLLEIYI